MESISESGGGAFFCRKCGARLLDGAQFCIQCGEQVKIAVQPEQSAQHAQPEPAPAQPAPVPLCNAEPVQAEPLPSTPASAKRKKPRPPRKPMKPWLVVLLSAAGTFAVLGTATVIIFVSSTK